MRKLTPEEIGKYRQFFMLIMTGSQDTCAGVTFNIDIKSCMEMADALSTKINQKIILSHVVNKLIALAIAENPVFNQVLLGGNIYQLEDIHVINNVLTPGKKQIPGCITLRNSNQKSLETIRQEFISEMFKLMKQETQPIKPWINFLVRIYFKAKLFKLIGEKKAFTSAYVNGMGSNILLSVHEYAGASRYSVIKTVNAARYQPLRFHVSRADAGLENGSTKEKKRNLQISFFGDHRVIFGVDTNKFIQSLTNIAADPEKYL